MKTCSAKVRHVLSLFITEESQHITIIIVFLANPKNKEWLLISSINAVMQKKAAMPTMAPWGSLTGGCQSKWQIFATIQLYLVENNIRKPKRKKKIKEINSWRTSPNAGILGLNRGKIDSSLSWNQWWRNLLNHPRVFSNFNLISFVLFHKFS